jgi:CRP-like cAMP-binding protein
MKIKNKVHDLENCMGCSLKGHMFRHLSEEELDIMNSGRYVMHFKAGELIYKQGSHIDHVISLTSGLVKLYIENKYKSVIIRFIRPVAFIGGPGMYVDNMYHNSAAAVEDSIFCFIKVDNFKRVILSNAHFAEELLKSVSTISLSVFERLTSMSVKQTPGLVADALIYFSDYVYKSKCMNLTMSRQDIADYIGLTKEGVIRSFKEFKDSGLINLKGNCLEIIDYNYLKRISEIG